jgi:hypothetical protein
MGELMNRIVKTIIDEWDPIDLFPLAPNDEYQNEIKEIVDFIYKNENTSPLDLAKEINRVFTTRFGADVYEKDVNECLLVAQKILLTISAT